MRAHTAKFTRSSQLLLPDFSLLLENRGKFLMRTGNLCMVPVNCQAWHGTRLSIGSYNARHVVLGH